MRDVLAAGDVTLGQAAGSCLTTLHGAGQASTRPACGRFSAGS